MPLQSGTYFRQKQQISRTTADADGDFTSLTIAAPGVPLFKGQVLTILDWNTGKEYDMTLQTDVASTGTTLTVSRTQPDTGWIRKGSAIILKGANQISQLRDSYYHRLHINAFYSPSVANAAKFYMGYGGHYNFNIASTAWADGGTKANNFSTKWAWFSAIRECTIVETNIVYSSANQTDSGAPFNTSFSLWGCAPTIDGTSNCTMTELQTLTLTGSANTAYVQKTNSTTHATLAAGSQLIPTFGPLSATPSSTAPDFYAEIEVIIYCTQ
jgi:hypothetical protein